MSTIHPLSDEQLLALLAALPVERPPDRPDFLDMLREERRGRRAAQGWPT